MKKPYIQLVEPWNFVKKPTMDRVLLGSEITTILRTREGLSVVDRAEGDLNTILYHPFIEEFSAYTEERKNLTVVIKTPTEVLLYRNSKMSSIDLPQEMKNFLLRPYRGDAVLVYPKDTSICYRKLSENFETERVLATSTQKERIVAASDTSEGFMVYAVLENPNDMVGHLVYPATEDWAYVEIPLDVEDLTEELKDG